MENNIKEELKESLKIFSEKNITIKQTGFIESQICIEELGYSIEYDTLYLIDKNQKNYLSINLNQIYKIEKLKNEIKLYLDNDTQLQIEM